VAALVFRFQTEWDGFDGGVCWAEIQELVYSVEVYAVSTLALCVTLMKRRNVHREMLESLLIGSLIDTLLGPLRRLVGLRSR